MTIEELPRHSAVSLTEKDRELALEQCRLQNATTPAQRQGMLDAMLLAKQVAYAGKKLSVEQGLELIRQLGALVEPEKARNWRTTPVVFRSGDVGSKPELLMVALRPWALAFTESTVLPLPLYYYFEKVHPFEDGNGRVGHCLWLIAAKWQTDRWPEELPRDVFAEDYAPPRQSAFGEVEES